MNKFILLIVTFVIVVSCSDTLTPGKTINNVYVVKQGETLFDISRKVSIDVSELYDLNPDIKEHPEIWKAGYRLNTGHVMLDTKLETEHIIQQGETLFSISRRYNVSVAYLKKINPKLDLNTLKVGTSINIVN